MWKVVNYYRNGQTYPDNASTLYRFEDGRITVQADGKPSADLQYSVDASKTPRHLNVTRHTTNGEQVSPMIFQVKGEDLAVCYAPSGQARPDSFAAAAGGTSTLIRMQRADLP